MAGCDAVGRRSGVDGPAGVGLLVIRVVQGAPPEPVDQVAVPRGESRWIGLPRNASGRQAHGRPGTALRVLDHTRRNCEQRSGREPRGLGHTRRRPARRRVRHRDDGRVHHRLRTAGVVHAERVGGFLRRRRCGGWRRGGFWYGGVRCGWCRGYGAWDRCGCEWGAWGTLRFGGSVRLLALLSAGADSAGSLAAPVGHGCRYGSGCAVHSAGSDARSSLHASRSGSRCAVHAAASCCRAWGAVRAAGRWARGGAEASGGERVRASAAGAGAGAGGDSGSGCRVDGSVGFGGARGVRFPGFR